MVTNDPSGMAAHLDAEAAAHATHMAGMAGHGMTASAIALLCTALEPRAKDDDDIASCLVALTAQAAEIARLKEALELFRGFGCPQCNGDCGSANPPVVSCPMLIAARNLTGSQSHD